jgi:hypothetical protein
MTNYVERLDSNRISKEDRERCERLIVVMRNRLGEKELLRYAGENLSPETVVEALGSEKVAEELDPKELGMKRIIEMLREVKPDITAAEIEKLIKEGDEKAEN